MKLIVARLEALEARSQQSIILLVAFKDGNTKEMDIVEFKGLSKEQRSDCDSIHIVSGDNVKEFDEHIDMAMKMLSDIINNPVPNRNIKF